MLKNICCLQQGCHETTFLHYVNSLAVANLGLTEGEIPWGLGGTASPQKMFDKIDYKKVGLKAVSKTFVLMFFKYYTQ